MTVSVLVVGAGSIGARHARNLADLGARVDIADPDRVRRETLAREVGGREVDIGDLGSTDHDGVVVASPTSSHVEQGLSALSSARAVFVEKPLGVGLAEARELVAAGGDRLMVGYNLRLHEPNLRLFDLVASGAAGRVTAIRLWFGFYLPDWRSGVDYRQTYSAHRAQGGGVLLDAIHELDLAVWFRGPELSVRGAQLGRLGDLEIDTEDTVRIMVVDPVGIPVSVELDYLSRQYRRGIEVVGTDATLRLDWARKAIEIEEPSRTHSEPATTPVDLSYVRQAERFLAMLDEGMPPPCDGATGLVSVRLAEEARMLAS